MTVSVVRPKEVHLEQAHLLDRLHVVGGDDFLVLCTRHRNQLGERLRRDHDTCGMNAGAANQTFKPHRSVDQLS